MLFCAVVAKNVLSVAINCLWCNRYRKQFQYKIMTLTVCDLWTHLYLKLVHFTYKFEFTVNHVLYARAYTR